MKKVTYMMQIVILALIGQQAVATDLFCYTPDTKTRFDISLHQQAIRSVEISAVDIANDVQASVAHMSLMNGNLKELNSGAQMLVRHPKSQINKLAHIEDRALAQIQWLEINFDGQTESLSSVGEQFEGQLKMTLRNGRTMAINLTCFHWLKE